MTAKIDMTMRLYNRPLMADDHLADHLKNQSRINAAVEIDDQSVQMNQMWSSVSAGERKPYRMEGSVAVIPVNGTLYHKVDWAGHSYTGYGFITAMLDYAAADSDVKGIALDISSGGGEVDGAFETSAKIAAVATDKPVLTMATHAYSAAYLLASASTKINVTQTGGVGSIGVVTAHVDYSKAMDKMGIDVTLLYKGKHKVDGNSYEPLPKDVQNRIESRLESTYSLFVDTVGNNRSMNSQVIRDTEALTYGAQEALNLGLVDSVGSSEDALAAFVAELHGKTMGNIMTAHVENKQATTNAESGNEASGVALTQAHVDAARSEGTKIGAETERTRILGILGCEEAKGRDSFAQVLCKQGLSVEAAKEILAAAPKTQETTASTGSNFESAMTTTANPNMGAESTGASSDVPAWKTGLESYSKASGQKLELSN